MIQAIPVTPVGLPGLAVLMAGFAVFMISLLVARTRAAPDVGGTTQRSLRSLGGIMLQGFAVAVVGFGPIEVTLDPMSARSLISAAAVAALIGGTIALFTSASRAMGKNWAIVASTRSDHQLITSGPFAYVRNPIYVALFLMQLALAVAFGHYAHLIVGVPLYWLGTMRRVVIEERLLRKQFGDAYDAYAARVKRFVPGVF